MFLREEPEPEILRDVGVLILVHQHVFKAVLIFAQNLRVFLKEAEAFEQQITEVSCVQNFEAFLVGSVEAYSFAIAEKLGIACGDFIWGEPSVLPTVNVGCQLAGGPALLVYTFRLDELF